MITDQLVVMQILRDAGLWEEASAFKEGYRQALRQSGMTRQAAKSESWHVMERKDIETLIKFGGGSDELGTEDTVVRLRPRHDRQDVVEVTERSKREAVAVVDEWQRTCRIELDLAVKQSLIASAGAIAAKCVESGAQIPVRLEFVVEPESITAQA